MIKIFIWGFILYWGVFLFITGTQKTLPAHGFQSNRPLIPVLKPRTYDQLNQLFNHDQSKPSKKDP